MKLSHTSPLLLVAASSPWPSLACKHIIPISLHLHITFSVSVYFSVSHEDTLIGFRANPKPVWSHLNPYLNYICKETSFPKKKKKSHSEVLGGLEYAGSTIRLILFLPKGGKWLPWFSYIVLPFLTSMICLPQIKFSWSSSGFCSVPLICLFRLHCFNYNNFGLSLLLFIITIYRMFGYIVNYSPLRSVLYSNVSWLLFHIISNSLKF